MGGKICHSEDYTAPSQVGVLFVFMEGVVGRDLFNFRYSRHLSLHMLASARRNSRDKRVEFLQKRTDSFILCFWFQSEILISSKSKYSVKV